MSALALIHLGFDCRDFKPASPARRWPEDRRAVFLLDPGTPLPISLDTMVLPSLFPEFNSAGLDAGPYLDCPALDCLPLDWASAIVRRAWPDIAGLIAVLGAAGIEAPWPDCLLLESAVHVNAAMRNDALWSGLLSLSSETLDDSRASVGPPGLERRFLGFDVVDASAYSALMNCGYTAEEVDRLRKAWAPRLNQVGLIREFTHALEFLELSNQRVKEHAPFAVVALHGWSKDADASFTALI